MSEEFKKRIISSFLLIPLSFFFIIKGSFLFNFFLFTCLVITVYEWHMMSKNKKYYFFGLLFLFFSFFCTLKLRNNFAEDGLNIFLLVILTCISTDIGGYIFGKIFKGPKISKISPKKTYSGMFGGYFLSIIIITIFIKSLLINYSDFNKYLFETLIIVVIISTISQIGDLIISYFKRKSKIKDTGKIIPGHGGLLDRIDGMIFAFPFSFIIFSLDVLK